MTFDNFYAENSYAIAVAKKIAEQPGGEYSPAILCGPSGVGKSHILSAIACKAGASSEDYNIIFTSAMDFVEELILAIKNGEEADFYKKYCQADMLLVDDFEQVAGKEQTQYELLKIFNDYAKNNKQLVLSISDSPREHNFAEKIQSRLDGGILLHMALPQSEAKQAIVEGIAKEWGLELDAQIKALLAHKLRTAAEIKGALKNIKIALRVTGRYPTEAELINRIPQLQ